MRLRTVGASFLQPFNPHFAIGVNGTTLALILEPRKSIAAADRCYLRVHCVPEAAGSEPRLAFAKLGAAGC